MIGCRLKLVSEAEPILNNLIASLESHKRWLDEKEGSMEESEVDESDPEDAKKRKDETEVRALMTSRWYHMSRVVLDRNCCRSCRID